MFDAAIKAQWSYHCFVMPLKLAELHFLFCRSAQCALLFDIVDLTKRRHSVAQDQTDDRDDEETEEDDKGH